MSINNTLLPVSLITSDTFSKAWSKILTPAYHEIMRRGPSPELATKEWDTLFSSLNLGDIFMGDLTYTYNKQNSTLTVHFSSNYEKVITANVTVVIPYEDKDVCNECSKANVNKAIGQLRFIYSIVHFITKQDTSYLPNARGLGGKPTVAKILNIPLSVVLNDVIIRTECTTESVIVWIEEWDGVEVLTLELPQAFLPHTELLGIKRYSD